MIEIKTEDMREAVQKCYDFDKQHGKCKDESSGQFTGNFYEETYEFGPYSRTYYFDNNKMFGSKKE